MSFAFCNTLIATEDSSPFSQLIDEETFLVAQIDLDKIALPDAKQHESLRVIYDMLAKVPADFSSDDDQKLVAKIKPIKEFLAAIGLKNIYIIGKAKIPVPVYFAIPKKDNINIELLKPYIAAFPMRIEFRETEDFKLIIPITKPPNSPGSDEPAKRIADSVVPKNKKDRKEFAEAFNAVKNYPVKILFVIPDYVKRILHETKPVIFEQDKRVDFQLLLKLFRWQAIGIDPSKPELHAVTECQNANQTNDFLTEINDLLDVSIDRLLAFSKEWYDEKDEFDDASQYLDNSPQYSLARFFTQNHKSIRRAIAPTLKGNSVVLHYSDKNFFNAADKLSGFVTKILPVIKQARTPDKCKNNIKQLILAFHNHHDTNGTLPDAFTVDASGKRLHSWRVLILPYLEQQALYQSIRRNEPWDSEHNKQFHNKMPAVFHCPDNKSGQKNRDTVYCVIIGKDSVFKEDGKGLSFDKLTDGTSNTVAIFERKEAVCWMKPEDISQEDALKGINKGGNKGIHTHHGKSTNIGVFDGSTRKIPATFDLKKLRAIITPAGRETVAF
jgi:hypothetical protein